MGTRIILTILLFSIFLCPRAQTIASPSGIGFEKKLPAFSDEPRSDQRLIIATGTVKDANANPVVGMQVESSIRKTRATTNREGFFRIEIQNNEQLKFSKADFETVQIDPRTQKNYSNNKLAISIDLTTVINGPPPPGPPPPSPPGPPPPPTGIEGSRLKKFPNPYPNPSGVHPLAPGIFARARTMGEVSAILSRALDECGYDEKRYYYFPPGGFALVTKMEQTDKDGISLPSRDRWSTNISQDINDPIDYIRSLLTAPVGYYRIFVFLVADTTTSASGREISESQALNWLERGYSSLPGVISRAAKSANHSFTLLVYQYRKTENNTSQIRNISGRENFVRSRLARFLR